MLYPVTPLPVRPVDTQDYPFAAAALAVVFAAHDSVSELKANQRLRLASAPVESPDDAYLVLPLRARAELLGALARGNLGRIAGWLDEAVVVRAELDRGRASTLWVGEVWSVPGCFESPATALSSPASRQLLDALNDLAPARTLCPEGLFDAEVLHAMRTREVYLGPTRSPEDEGFDEPLSWVWSVRQGERVIVRAVFLSDEDDGFTAMIAPAVLGQGVVNMTPAPAPPASNVRRLHPVR